MTESEFVSISRASQLLEAPERTVRRMADKLADTDRQLAAKGGRLVRLSALASLMGKPLPMASVADSPGEVADTEAASGRHLADTEPGLADKKEQLADTLADSGGHSEGDWRTRALVAEARLADTQAERDRLIKEKAEESEKFIKALETIQRAQDETRAARVMSSGRVVQQIEASGLAGDAQSEVSASAGGITTPSASEEPKRGFWARLRGRG